MYTIKVIFFHLYDVFKLTQAKIVARVTIHYYSTRYD